MTASRWWASPPWTPPQELYDLLTALLFQPGLPGRIGDIVVEFGNALYQDLADRFVLGDQAVAAAELAQIWRTTGDPLWDAPVFEQFFRTVRAVNWMLPSSRRIRVLLGLPPFDPARVRGSADWAYLDAYEPHYDAHIAAVTEREVLAKGRRALLIAGGGHLLRGLHADQEPRLPNAGALLAQRHPGALFVVDTIVLSSVPDPDSLVRRAQTVLARWPRPSVAPLAGTWLGAVARTLAGGAINWGAGRALTVAAVRYGAQADAALYLGPAEILTASRPDPAIYHWGTYPAALHRLSRAIARIDGPLAQEDLAAEGLALAQRGPRWLSAAQTSARAQQKRAYCRTHRCARTKR